MKEEWKDVKGFKGFYQVSNYGKIRSVDRYVNAKNGSKSFLHGKEMKIQKSRKGYCVIILHKENKIYQKQVHRLVGEAFIENPKKLPQINHKDMNKENNFCENLEWITNADNMRHSYQNGNHGGFTEKRRAAVINNLKTARKKLEKPVVQYDIKMNKINEFQSMSDAERQTNINNSKICVCCKGKRKTAGGYIWKYKESEIKNE